MPKISRNSLINLTAFRQANGLLQQDVANYLGVSRGFISMVEKGTTKLSRKNLDKLFDGREVKNWDISDLVPAWTRINKVMDYLNGERYQRRIERGETAQLFGFDPELWDKIQYGEIGLSESYLFIQIWCEEAPEISKEWLLTGVGEMLSAKEGEAHEKTPIEILSEEIRELKDRITSLEGLIKSSKEEIINTLKG